MAQTSQTFKGEISKTGKLNYWLHVPAGKAPEGGWPVIVFLHGAGERGNNLTLVKKHGIPKVAGRDKDFPFIAISPQCPKYSWWLFHFEDVMAVLDQVLDTQPADRSRVYLTGMSMGGNGTWGLAYRYPKRFAAIAPICGHDLFITGVMENPRKLRDIPIWAFHGAMDFGVPPMESAMLCDKLQKLGADVRFTVYPLAGHDSWTETYANPELYTWFLTHRLEI